jgi:branched-subunit amino acid aminotransferase/4-amino-4-deoxychorismate lyase
MDGEATIIITIGDLSLVEPKEELYNLGIKTILIDFQRIIPEAKTTSYLMAIKNQKRKKESKAMEIIYQHKNLLLEGATSNIFIVKDGVIITPIRNILSGTMRNLIIKLLEKEDVIVETRDIMVSEALSADEIFLTGTFKNILPVRQIDDKIIGNGQVGKITRKAISLLKKYI